EQRGEAIHDRAVLVGGRGHGELAVLTQDQPGPAGAEPRGPSLGKCFLEHGETAELTGQSGPDRARRLAATAWLHDLPEERVVGMAAAVVTHGRPDPLGQRVQVGDQGLDRLVLMVGMVLERGVQIVDVRRMMLAMVYFHGPGINVRLQGTKVVWQRRQSVLSHGVAPRRISEDVSHGRRRSPRGRRRIADLARAPNSPAQATTSGPNRSNGW